MIDNTFLRSYKLVPEVNRPFLYSSLIAMAATLIRMIGPQLISRGIDNGVLKSDYNYLLEQSFYYFLTLIALYFVASKALLSIGLVGELYVRRVREKLFRHLSSLDINYFEKNKTGVYYWYCYAVKELRSSIIRLRCSPAAAHQSCEGRSSVSAGSLFCVCV